MPFARLGVVPLVLPGAVFDVWREGAAIAADHWHAYVATGTWTVAGHDLVAGDSVRGGGELAASGAGELLLWQLDRAPLDLSSDGSS